MKPSLPDELSLPGGIILPKKALLVFFSVLVVFGLIGFFSLLSAGSFKDFLSSKGAGDSSKSPFSALTKDDSAGGFLGASHIGAELVSGEEIPSPENIDKCVTWFTEKQKSGATFTADVATVSGLVDSVTIEDMGEYVDASVVFVGGDTFDLSSIDSIHLKMYTQASPQVVGTQRLTSFEEMLSALSPGDYIELFKNDEYVTAVVLSCYVL